MEHLCSLKAYVNGHISFDFTGKTNHGKIECRSKFVYFKKKLKIDDLNEISDKIHVFACIFTYYSVFNTFIYEVH